MKYIVNDDVVLSRHVSLAKTGVARLSLTIANTFRQEPPCVRHHRNVLRGCRDEHVRLQATQGPHGRPPRRHVARH